MGGLLCRTEWTISEAELLSLREETGFSYKHLRRLLQRFQNLDRDRMGTLTREDLYVIPEVATNPLGERIVEMFFTHTGNTHQIDFKDFVRVFAIFQPVADIKHKKKEDDDESYEAINSRQSKLMFMFSLLDLNGDGYFGLEELRELLELMLGANVTEEQIEQVSRRVLYEGATLSEDEDGGGDKEFMTFETFVKILENFDVEHKLSMETFAK